MADKEIKAEATVVLNTRDIDAAAQRVKRVNDGVAKEAKKAAREQAAEQKKLTAAQEREAKRRADAERKTLDAVARDEKRAIDAQAREHQRYQERLTRMHREEVAKRTQQELAEERKSLATRKKEWQGFWKGVRGMATGTAAGALAGGGVAVSTARGIAGVEDAGSRLKKANDVQRRLISLGKDAGMNEQQIGNMRDTVVSASTKYGTDISDLVSGLEDAHGRFNLLSAALKDIDNITKTSTAKMMNFGEVIGMMGSAKQAFELTDAEMPAALSTILSGTSVGAINSREFSGPFAPLMGSFALNTKQKGLGGLSMFVAGAEGVGTGQFGGEESATRFKNMISSLNDAKIITKLRAIGIKDFRGKDGSVDLGKFIEEAAASKQFQSATTRQKIFIEDRAREGIETLMAAREKRIRKVDGAVDYASLMKTDASAGAKSVDDTIRMFDKYGALNLDKVAAAEQARTIDQMKNLNSQVEAVAGSFSRLLGAMDENMGGAGSFLETWGSAIGAGGLGAMASKLLGGGSAAGAGAGALRAALGASSAGTAISGLVAGGGAGAAAIGTGLVTGTGVAAYGLTRAADNLWGWGSEKLGGSGRNFSEMIGAGLSNLVNDIDGQRARLEQSGNPAPKSPTSVSADGVAIVAELRKSTEVQKQVAAKLPARPAMPGTGNRGAR